MARLDIYLWAMLTFLVLLGVAVILTPPDGAARAFIVDGGRLATAVVAALFVVRAFTAARGRGPILPTWVLCGAGIVAWLVGDAVAGYYRLALATAPPYPSFHSAVMGVGYALVITGAALEVARPAPGASGHALAGALAVVALGLVLTANFVVIPALRNPVATVWEKAADVFFAAADFGLASLALVLVARHGPSGFARPWVYISLGFLFYTMGDVIQWHLAAAGGGGETGNVVSLLFWTAGYLLVGLGAYYRRLISLAVVPYPASRYVSPEVDGS